MRSFPCAIFIVVLTASAAMSKVYWLPDFMETSAERNARVFDNPTDSKQPDNKCAAYFNMLTAAEIGNMECTSHTFAFGKCYSDCTCNTGKYPYTFANCNNNQYPSGSTCVDTNNVKHFAECLCNARFQYSDTNNKCGSGNKPDGNFCTDSHNITYADNCSEYCPGEYSESQVQTLLAQGYICNKNESGCYTCHKCGSEYVYNSNTCSSPRELSGSLCYEVDGLTYATSCTCKADTIEESAVLAKEKDGYVCFALSDGCYTCGKVECDGTEGYVLLPGTNQCSAVACKTGYATSVEDCGVQESNSQWTLSSTDTAGKSAGIVCRKCEISCNSGYLNLDTHWCNGALRCTWK